MAASARRKPCKTYMEWDHDRHVRATLSIRKQKRMESVMKRRTAQLRAGDETLPTSGDDRQDISRRRLDDAIFALESAQSAEAKQEKIGQLRCLLEARLSVTKEPLEIDQLARILNQSHPLLLSADKALQLEVLLLITCLVSGDIQQTRQVVESGYLPLLLSFVREASNRRLCEQAIGALGNIIVDSTTYRDRVIKEGLVPGLLNCMELEARYLSNKTPSTDNCDQLLRNGTWVISLLCRGNPPADYTQIKTTIPTIVRMLNWKRDLSVVREAAECLSILSDHKRTLSRTSERIEELLSFSVLPQLVRLLAPHLGRPLNAPALRTIGNIAAGTDSQVDRIIEAGGLAGLVVLLSNEDSDLKREAAWTISNMAIGGRAHLEAIMASNAVPKLIEVALHAEFKVSREAGWALCNILGGASPDQLAALATHSDIMKAMTRMLEGHDYPALHITLEALRRILAPTSPHRTSFCSRLPVEFLRQLENLEDSENHSVSEAAQDILRFFERRVTLGDD